MFLKHYDTVVTFSEFPDEISLCVNITGCPGMCKNCSEPWLKEDIGTELLSAEIDFLIKSNPGITVFALMGGDADHKDVARIANYIHTSYPGLKVGMYSGRDYLNLELLDYLDYYKIGRWILPEGPEADWWRINCGPIQFPFSNQLLFKKDYVNGEVVWLNITYRFRDKPLNNLNQYIIK